MVRIFGVNIGRKEPPQATNLTASFREEDAELKVILKELRVVDYVLSYITETDKSKADLTLSLLKGLLKEGDLPKANDLISILGLVDGQKKKFESEQRSGRIRRGQQQLKPFDIIRNSPSQYQLLIEICIGLVESARRHDERVMAIVASLFKKQKSERLPPALSTDITFFKKMSIVEGINLINSLNYLVKALEISQQEHGRSSDMINRIRSDISQIISEIEQIFKVKGQTETHLGIKL